MPKAYWITSYRKVLDADKLTAYAKLAAPSIEAAGGRFLVRGVALHAFEDGVLGRTVVIEFESIERALAAHESVGYQAALAALGDGAVRDLRIVPGV